jgi:acid phosphatase type 7
MKLLNTAPYLLNFLLVFSLFLFAVSGCTNPAQSQGTQTPESRGPLAIASFSVTPLTTQPSQPVTFTWSLTNGAKPTFCTLDVEGDGNVDYTFDDCQATLVQAHEYKNTGHYQAVFTVTDGAETKTATINTVVSSPTEIVTILAAGDIACDPASEHFNGGLGTEQRCRQKYVADLIGQFEPDAVLTLGDTQYEENTMKQFMASYDVSWGEYKAITYPVVGNHEYLTRNAADYFSYFGAAAGDPDKGYYSYDLGAWHLIALNSNCDKVDGCDKDSVQGQWLQADLAAHENTCTLAYWHHPRFSSGQHGNNKDYIDFWTLLQQAGAELILVGHDHNYEHFAPQDAHGNADAGGIVQFVVGTGGKGVRPLETLQPNSEVQNSEVYGALELSLEPSSYRWTFRVENPLTSFSDSGQAECH